jgi:hypothetical protein
MKILIYSTYSFRESFFLQVTEYQKCVVKVIEVAYLTNLWITSCRAVDLRKL